MNLESIPDIAFRIVGGILILGSSIAFLRLTWRIEKEKDYEKENS